MERLKRYPWDGNARELENVIERALALSANRELAPQDIPLPDDAGQQQAGRRLEDSLLDASIERRLTLRGLGDRYIERVLELTGGNKVQAARILGINRRTLYRRGDHSEASRSEDAEGVST